MCECVAFVCVCACLCVCICVLAVPCAYCHSQCDNTCHSWSSAFHSLVNKLNTRTHTLHTHMHTRTHVGDTHAKNRTHCKLLRVVIVKLESIKLQLGCSLASKRAACPALLYILYSTNYLLLSPCRSFLPPLPFHFAAEISQYHYGLSET